MQREQFYFKGRNFSPAQQLEQPLNKDPLSPPPLWSLGPAPLCSTDTWSRLSRARGPASSVGRKLSPAGLIHHHSQQQLALQEVTPELEPDPARSQVPEITYPGGRRRTSTPAGSSDRASGGARTPSRIPSCWGTSPQENGSAFWHKTSPCRVHPHVLKWQKGRKTTKKSKPTQSK